jgi:hypothetical protein
VTASAKPRRKLSLVDIEEICKRNFKEFPSILFSRACDYGKYPHVHLFLMLLSRKSLFDFSLSFLLDSSCRPDESLLNFFV